MTILVQKPRKQPRARQTRLPSCGVLQTRTLPQITNEVSDVNVVENIRQVVLQSDRVWGSPGLRQVAFRRRSGRCGASQRSEEDNSRQRAAALGYRAGGFGAGEWLENVSGGRIGGGQGAGVTSRGAWWGPLRKSQRPVSFLQPQASPPPRGEKGCGHSQEDRRKLSGRGCH